MSKYYIDEDGYICSEKGVIASMVSSDHIQPLSGVLDSHDPLVEALEKIYKYIDDGILVRNLERDNEDGWAMEMLEFVQVLTAGKQALAGGKEIT